MNRRAFLSAACLIALAGCGAAPAVPQSRFYRLTLERTSQTSGTPLFPGNLEIDVFSANGIAGDRPLLYSRDEGRTLMQRNYAYWAEPPAQMIRSVLADYLRHSSLFGSVSTSELRLPADYRLRGKLTAIYQKVADGDGAQGVGTGLSLDIDLLDLKNDQILLAKSFEAAVRPKGSAIDDAAGAINEGLANILTELGRELRARK